MKFFFLYVVAIALVSGCANRAAPNLDSKPEEAHASWAEMPAPPPLTITLVVSKDPPEATSVSEVRTVDVKMYALGLQVPNALELHLLTPSGSLYQRSTAALEGSPFNEQNTVFQLPVSGTAIDSNSVSGTWTAKLLVNGEDAASQNFELTP
jgi:hypothetical protein